MKRSGIDRPGAAGGVIRGQSPRKSALSSPRPRLAEATAIRALAIATAVTTIGTALATITAATSSSALSLWPFSADSPAIGLLPQRRVKL